MSAIYCDRCGDVLAPLTLAQARWAQRTGVIPRNQCPKNPSGFHTVSDDQMKRVAACGASRREQQRMSCRKCGGRGWVTEPGPEYNLPNQIVCDECGGVPNVAAAAVRLFPPGCVCSSYGRGLTMTRVTSPSCPVHGERLLSFEEYARLVADD